MRHQKKRHKLGRTQSHRKATLAALTTALVAHKRITTTLPKARALRVYIEPIVTRAKDDTTHNRREVFRHLQDKAAVTTLFTEVADAVGDRPGGYTRIVKLGQRAGDGAEMAVIELVDFGAEGPETSKSGRRRTRRGGSRRGKKATQAAAATQTTVETSDQKLPEKGVETAVVEEPVSEAQAVPVPERTEPHAEAEAIAEEKAAATPEATAEAVEEAQAEQPAVEAETVEAAPVDEPAAEPVEAEAAEEEADVAEQSEAQTETAEAEPAKAEVAPAETEEAEADIAEQPEAKAEGEEAADEGADDEEKK